MSLIRQRNLLLHLLNLLHSCFIFYYCSVSICPDPVKLNQVRFSLHVAVVISFCHLKPDSELTEVITPQILSALLSNERFWVSQQFKDIVQGLTCHADNLIVRPPSELCTARAPEPDLLDVVQFLMMPDRYEDKVLPVIVVSVMIAVVDLQPLPLHFPIIWQKHHAHDLLYGEGLFRAVLLPFPLIWHGVQRNDFVLIRCARWNITHRTIFE